MNEWFDKVRELNPEALQGWPGIIAVGLVVFALVFIVMRLFGGRTPTSGLPPIDRGPMDKDVLALEARLARQAPTGRDEEQIAPELRKAGYYDPKALSRFQLIRTSLILVPLSIAGFLAFIAPRDYLIYIIAGGVVLASLGFSLPRVYINLVGRSRSRQVEAGLPVALDLVSLGLLGGQNIQGAFGRAAEAVRGGYPLLADEMGLVLKQTELKTFPLALDQWADRSGVAEVQNLAVAISQSDKLGVDVSSAMLELSSAFRMGLRQRAEGQANRAAVWMLFPTTICLFVPAAMLLAAPLYFEFQDRRAKLRDLRPGRAEMTEQLKNASKVPSTEPMPADQSPGL